MGILYNKVVIFAVVFLLPMVPTIVLYYFFTKENYAKYLSKKVQLGGPIAAYVILIGLSFYYFANITDPEMQQIVEDFIAKEKVIQNVRGTWDYTTIIKDLKREYSGTCVLSKRDKGLIMEGETEYFITQPMLINHRGMELTYFFRAGNDFEKQAMGMGILRLKKTKGQERIDKMTGCWGVTGEQICGEVTFLRRRDSY
jgi:hypothetical protein